MRKWLQIALAVLLALLAGILGWQVVGDCEPVYQGKSASYWMNYDYRGPNPDSTFREAWKGLGSNAVPFLVQALDRRDANRLITYRSLWTAMPPWLRNRDSIDRSTRRPGAGPTGVMAFDQGAQ